jgi:hypothetical protein
MPIPRFIVMTSRGGPRGKWGQYRNVALVETDQQEMPKMISRHAKHLVRVVYHYGAHYEGSTERCAYRVALAHAEARAAKLNAEGV